MSKRSSVSDFSPSEAQRLELARWTHLWTSAAAMLQQQIRDGIDREPCGDRDLHAVLTVQAVRNVYRGAVALLGEGSAPVSNFCEAQPHMKHLRDCLEHFDEYVTGGGCTQQKQKQKQKQKVELGGRPGFRWIGSHGDNGSHTFVTECVDTFGSEDEPDGRRIEVEPVGLVDDARVLARAALDTVPTLQHDDSCPACARGAARPSS